MDGKSFLINLGDSLYYKLLANHLRGMGSVIDVGCGSRSPLAKIPKLFRSIGVDAFSESIKKSKKADIHDQYIVGDVTKLNFLIPPKSVDAAIALDLIEHLTKKEGEQLLKNMETIARKKVIVMTPNGYYNQEPYEGNPYQIHKSGWILEDFTDRGYVVHGIRGPKWLRAEYAAIRFRPWLLWGAISSMLQLPFYFFPRVSYQLFAVKEL